MKAKMMSGAVASYILHATLFLILALLTACGGGGGSGEESGKTGSIAVQLHQVEEGGASLAQVRCYPNDSNIVYVEVRIYDETNALVANGGPWDCNLHQGVVNNVPAGCNITVVALGQDDQLTNIYRGEATACVVAGQTTQVTVELTSFSVAVSSPTTYYNYYFYSGSTFLWYGGWERNSIQVADDADTDYASPVVDEPEVISTTFPREYDPQILTYMGVYRWRVRALDDFDNATGWSEGAFSEQRFNNP